MDHQNHSQNSIEFQEEPLQRNENDNHHGNQTLNEEINEIYYLLDKIHELKQCRVIPSKIAQFEPILKQMLQRSQRLQISDSISVSSDDNNQHLSQEVVILDNSEIEHSMFPNHSETEQLMLSNHSNTEQSMLSNYSDTEQPMFPNNNVYWNEEDDIYG
jgi:hypothetical protein